MKIEKGWPSGHLEMHLGVARMDLGWPLGHR